MSETPVLFAMAAIILSSAVGVGWAIGYHQGFDAAREQEGRFGPLPDDSPCWATDRIATLAARRFERVNDPRRMSGLRQRAGGDDDAGFTATGVTSVTLSDGTVLHAKPRGDRGGAP